MSGDDNSRVLERAKQAWNREKGREKTRQKSPSYWQSVVRRGGLRKRGLERERSSRTIVDKSFRLSRRPSYPLITPLGPDRGTDRCNDTIQRVPPLR